MPHCHLVLKQNNVTDHCSPVEQGLWETMRAGINDFSGALLEKAMGSLSSTNISCLEERLQ